MFYFTQFRAVSPTAGQYQSHLRLPDEWLPKTGTNIDFPYAIILVLLTSNTYAYGTIRIHNSDNYLFISNGYPGGQFPGGTHQQVLFYGACFSYNL